MNDTNEYESAGDYLPRLARALDKWADAMNECAADVAARLACSEAEAVADLLHASGNHDTAAYFLSEHVSGDDDGDPCHAELRRELARERHDNPEWATAPIETRVAEYMRTAGLPGEDLDA